MQQTENPTEQTWMNPEFEPGLVSVIVPTYNRAHLIVETLDSVLAQTYRPIELLIIDDGSTDNTPEVVRKWISEHGEEDFTIRFLEQENRGAPAARNHGLVESRGEFIQFLDSDDLLHPEKLDRQTRELVATKAEFVWANCGSFTSKPVWPGPGPSKPRVTSVVDHVTKGGHVNTVAGIYRRSTCMKIGRWDEELRVFQDREYNLRLFLFMNSIIYQPDVFVLVRKDHGERISGGYYSSHFGTALRAYESTLAKSETFNGEAREALAAVYFSHALQSLRKGHKKLALGSLNEASRLAQRRTRHRQIKVLQLATHLPSSLLSVLIEKTVSAYKRRRNKKNVLRLQGPAEQGKDTSMEMEC